MLIRAAPQKYLSIYILKKSAMLTGYSVLLYIIPTALCFYSVVVLACGDVGCGGRSPRFIFVSKLYVSFVVKMVCDGSYHINIRNNVLFYDDEGDVRSAW